jgi:hypothetical protein
MVSRSLGWTVDPQAPATWHKLHRCRVDAPRDIMPQTAQFFDDRQFEIFVGV